MEEVNQARARSDGMRGECEEREEEASFVRPFVFILSRSALFHLASLARRESWRVDSNFRNLSVSAIVQWSWHFCFYRLLDCCLLRTVNYFNICVMPLVFCVSWIKINSTGTDATAIIVFVYFQTEVAAELRANEISTSRRMATMLKKVKLSDDKQLK